MLGSILHWDPCPDLNASIICWIKQVIWGLVTLQRDINPTISIITLNINGLNVPIKSQIVRTHLKYFFLTISQHKTQLYVVYKKTTLNIKTHRLCGAMGNIITCWWKCGMVQPLWETVGQFLTKLNILLPCDAVSVVLGIYPKELKTYVYTKPTHRCL